MKLILKQYLASLKERSELDVILPDLLSKMGLNVFISPTRGVREYGVDIAATGVVGGSEERVYLFSVKSGNLTRSTWDGQSAQSLRPSLNEIIDSFIPNRLPSEHVNRPIVICLCFGGDINSNVRELVASYQRNNTKGNVSFEEWNGDKLSNLILDYLLQEQLLPKDWQSMLRKSLALVEEPEASTRYFQKLVHEILKKTDSKESVISSLTRINLCLWVLFSWCRDEENLEAAYISVEYVLLIAWDKVKSYPKLPKEFLGILDTYNTISKQYLDNCLIPYVGLKYSISNAINSPCNISINLKLFDLLGRLSIRGVWLLENLTKSYEKSPPTDEETQEQVCFRESLDNITSSVKSFIENNPLLNSPYKDSQAIDIGLALYLLSNNSAHDEFVRTWLVRLVNSCKVTYSMDSMYPTNLETYSKILELSHKSSKDEDYQKYKEKITSGSVLYPLLAIYCDLYELEDSSNTLENMAKENLSHCTLQYWYPDSSSEDCMYSDTDIHGAASVDFPMRPGEVMHHVREECQQSVEFYNMSAVKKGYKSIVLTACRYYRYPVPFHMLEGLIEQIIESRS